MLRHYQIKYYEMVDNFGQENMAAYAKGSVAEAISESSEGRACIILSPTVYVSITSTETVYTDR